MPTPDDTPGQARGDQPQARQFSAALLFGGMAVLVLMLTMGAELWRSWELTKILSSLVLVQQQAIPGAADTQRLVRNIETVRLEGERILIDPAPQQRQQSMYTVDVIAAKSLDARASPALRQARDLLSDITKDGTITPDERARWAVQSLSLAHLNDDITGESIERLNSDLVQVEHSIDRAYWLQAVSLGVLAVSMSLFVLVLYVALIRPLRRINGLIDAMRQSKGASQALVATPRTREIENIVQALWQLQALMQENESIRATLEVSASTDSLTGLKNRRQFMQEAELALARAKRQTTPLTVAIADLDHFKAINDSHGHAVGDLVLQRVAELMQATLRQTDIYCRYGGEEFAFVFPDTGMADARILAERLRESISEHPIDAGPNLRVRVTLSMGMVELGGMTLEDALHMADEAMYRAKIGGRNRIECAQTPMSPETTKPAVCGLAETTLNG